MSDDKIIEIKHFKKVNGEIINIKKKRHRKKKKKDTVQEFVDDDMPGNEDLEEELMQLMEENEQLYMELLKEKIRRETLEKLLNKILRRNQKDKKDE